MSSSVRFRRPAWPGLRPQLPVPVLVPDEEAETVRRLSGLSGTVCRLDFGDGPAGMFLLRGQEGDIFIKRVPADREGIASRAESLAAWLAGRGVGAIAPLPGFPKRLDDGDGLVALPYVHGRRLEAEPGELANLGKCLARLHAALAAHPEREIWLQGTRTRLERLRATRLELARGALQVGSDPQRLHRLASEDSLDFDRADLVAIPLHGDLNPGNVLLAEGKPVFLDFEDVFHSVLPAAFELGLVVERFVLVSASNAGQALRAGIAFLSAYASSAAPGVAGKFDPVIVLRSLALRSLCVLAGAEARGAMSPQEEWQKFFDLESMAADRASLLREIFESSAS